MVVADDGSVLGVGWSLLQPLAAMVVFAVFLGRLGGVGFQVGHLGRVVAA